MFSTGFLLDINTSILFNDYNVFLKLIFKNIHGDYITGLNVFNVKIIIITIKNTYILAIYIYKFSSLIICPLDYMH